MTEVEQTLRLIEYGYFDFFGLGTDIKTAELALEAAARADSQRSALS